MRKLREEHDFKFRIIADDPMDFEGFDVEFFKWSFDKEVPLLQECDIGVVPVKDSDWSPWKFFFKTIQFMSLGMPVVASATGSNVEIIEDGVNGFLVKTDKLIDWSAAVICGNRFIAEYVAQKNKNAVVVPTVVDTDKFFPFGKKEENVPVIGWIGTHSTFPFLKSLFPVFSKLAEKYEFVLKIVGAGKTEIDIRGVRVENLEWSLDREIKDFQSLDIGLYPMKTNDFVSKDWLMGF